MLSSGFQLAMSTAAVAATATVEPAATAVVPVTAAVASADEATRVAASVPVAAMSVVSTPAVVSAASIVAVAVIATPTVEAAAIVGAVVPRAGADEDAASEVIRAIVAVGGASVRVVTVVTVGADRGWADRAVNGANPDAHAKLRLGSTSGEKQNSQ